MKSIALAAAILIAMGLPGHAKQHSQKSQAIGDQTHPKILAQYGGAIKDQNLVKYVDQLGRKLVRHTDRADAKWTFTVLDSPIVNAFALPGGYIYITRGLLALANDEAELAGVLGHEIGHVTANHGTKRQKRASQGAIGVIGGAILGGLLDGKEGLKKGIQLGSLAAQGYTAQYSQKQEFEADTLGVRILLRAGYDPTAQADFLDSMGDAAGLQAKMAGKEYNPNKVNFFASHPATADRVRKAISEAKRASGNKAPTRRNQDQYLRQIDGMIYGDSPAQGFVRGRRFDHPELRFGFEVPKGFTILNAARSISAIGPKGAQMLMDGDKDPGGGLDRYLRDRWLPQLAKTNKLGRLEGMQRVNVNGLEGAVGLVSTNVKGAPFTAQLLVLRHNQRLFRLIGLAPRGDQRLAQSLANALRSFSPLSKAQASRLKPFRVWSYEVRPGDSVEMLARTLPFATLRKERMITLNGLDDRRLEAGRRVKLVLD